MPQQASDGAWTERHWDYLQWYFTAAQSEEDNNMNSGLDGRAAAYSESFPVTASFQEADTVTRGGMANGAWNAEAPAAEQSQDNAGKAASVRLEILIDYLEEEVASKALQARADAFQSQGPDAAGLVGHGLQGQEALDAYISELVSIIKDFPFDQLDEDKSVGAWVRDEIVAPVFKGSWDFYANKKLVGAGLDLPAFERILCGQNMLLERLHYARHAGGL